MVKRVVILGVIALLFSTGCSTNVSKDDVLRTLEEQGKMKVTGIYDVIYPSGDFMKEIEKVFNANFSDISDLTFKQKKKNEVIAEFSTILKNSAYILAAPHKVKAVLSIDKALSFVSAEMADTEKLYVEPVVKIDDDFLMRHLPARVSFSVLEYKDPQKYVFEGVTIDKTPGLDYSLLSVDLNQNTIVNIELLPHAGDKVIYTSPFEQQPTLRLALKGGYYIQKNSAIRYVDYPDEKAYWVLFRDQYNWEVEEI